MCAFPNFQLEFLPQKSELCAFLNLQREFLPQKSELCAFQNLQLEFLPQKSESGQIVTAKVQVKIQNPSCAFQNLQLGLFRVDTWLPSERSGYPLPLDG